jgi:hypothetical protein
MELVSRLAFKVTDIEIGSEFVDAIHLYQPIHDPRDVQVTKAVLDASGAHIRITMPTVPLFLRKDVVAIHKLEGDAACVRTMKEHGIVATAINSKDSRQTKDVILSFPDDITCNVKHFGNSVKKLKKEFRILEFKVSETFTHKALYLFWQVAIEREARRIETKDSDDSEDPIELAQKRMLMMNVG